MNKLITDINGGFPFYLNDFRFEQAAVRDALTAIFKAYGDNFIIQGCEYSGGVVTEGYIFLDGEILKVDEHAPAGSLPRYFNKVTSYDSDGDKTFYDGQTQQTYQVNRAEVTATVSNLLYMAEDHYGDRLVRPLTEIVQNSGGTAWVWNIRAAKVADVTIASSSTLSILNAVAGDEGIIIVRQGSSSLSTLSLPSNSTVEGGSLSFTTGLNAIDILFFIYDGADFHFRMSNDYS